MQSHQYVSACEIWVNAKQSLTSFFLCYFGSFHTQICKQRGSCAVISLVNILCSTDSRLLSIEAAAELKKRESESTCGACKHCNKEVLQSCWHTLNCVLTSAGLSECSQRYAHCTGASSRCSGKVLNSISVQSICFFRGVELLY